MALNLIPYLELFSSRAESFGLRAHKLAVKMHDSRPRQRFLKATHLTSLVPILLIDPREIGR